MLILDMIDDVKKNLFFTLFYQANIRELEEEVKLLKNLKHPNIVVSVILLR